MPAIIVILYTFAALHILEHLGKTNIKQWVKKDSLFRVQTTEGNKLEIALFLASISSCLRLHHNLLPDLEDNRGRPVDKNLSKKR